MSRMIARFDQVLTVANLPDQLAHKGLVVFHEQDLEELGASPVSYTHLTLPTKA